MIDNEKQPDTTLRECWAHGVEVISRYHKIAEIKAMLGCLDAISPEHRLWIKSLYCNSKSTADYGFEVDADTPLRAANAIARHAAIYFVEKHGGYNGITVGTERFGFGVTLGGLDADWVGYD